MKKILAALLFTVCATAQVTVVQSPVPKFRSFLPSGAPNVGGCVYTFASGTSTPQATYFDFTGLFANSNPVILDANGEAPIWITGQTYRFQVWSFGSGVIGSNCGNGTQLYQIDGVRDTGLNALNGPITIAPTANGIDIFDLIRATDVSPSGNFVNFKSFAGATLFKVDINGNVVASGGGAFSGAVSGTTGTFSGALSTTTGTFTGGVLNLTEVAAPSCPAGIDVIWADSTAHRPKGCGNGGGVAQFVISSPGTDISNLDAVTAIHFGTTQQALSSTAPTTGQFLQFNGTNIIGTTAPAVIAVANLTAQGANLGPTTLTTPGANGFYRFSCWLVLTQAATSSSTLPICTYSFTDADSGVAETVNVTNTSSANTPGTVGSTQANPLTFFAKSGVAIQYATSGYVSTGATPMQYAIHIRLEGPF